MVPNSCESQGSAVSHSKEFREFPFSVRDRKHLGLPVLGLVLCGVSVLLKDKSSL